MVNCGSTNLRQPKEYRSSIIDTYGAYEETFIESYYDKVENFLAHNDDEEKEDGEQVINFPKFYTLENFIEIEEWYKWFDPQEIAEWKSANQKIDATVKMSNVKGMGSDSGSWLEGYD